MSNGLFARHPRMIVAGAIATPDNNGYTWLYDSTRKEQSLAKSLPKSAAVPTTFGPDSGLAAGQEYLVTVTVATNNASLVAYAKDGTGAWAATITPVALTADTMAQTKITSYAAEILIGVLAGATAPTAVAGTVVIKEQPA